MFAIIFGVRKTDTFAPFDNFCSRETMPKGAKAVKGMGAPMRQAVGVEGRRRRRRGCRAGRRVQARRAATIAATGYWKGRLVDARAAAAAAARAAAKEEAAKLGQLPKCIDLECTGCDKTDCVDCLLESIAHLL